MGGSTRAGLVLFVTAAMAFLLPEPPTPSHASEPPLCKGEVATIWAESLGETLIGTPGPDVIVGSAGHDSIDGRGGNDRICAGAGDDVVLGGAGSDEIWGGAGADVLQGGRSSDQVYGGSGPDVVVGGGGDDALFGQKGSDDVRGNRGKDAINGGAGDDTADGGPHRDSCRAETMLRCEVGPPLGAGVLVFAYPELGDGIGLVRRDGSDRTRITNGADFAPQWSPDRSKIAFIRFVDGANELMVMNRNGTRLRRVSRIDNPGRNTIGFSWSPDGQHLVFDSVKLVPPEASDLYIVRNDGGEPAKLSGELPSAPAFPRWSPDGRYIVYCHYPDGGLGAHDLQGEFDPNITAHVTACDHVFGNKRLFFSMSIDGDRDLFAAWVGLLPPEWLNNNDGIWDAYPQPSPDESEVAFITARGPSWEVFALDLSTKTERQLTNNQRLDQSPIWSPDGNAIAWVTVRNDAYEIWVMNADGSNKHRVAPGREFDW